MIRLIAIFNCRLLLNPLLFSNRIEFFLLHTIKILYRLIFNNWLDPLPFSDLIESFQLLICKFVLIRKIILHLLINRLFKRLLFSYWLNPLFFSDLIEPLLLLINRLFKSLLFNYWLDPLSFSDLIEPFQLLINSLFFSRLFFCYSLFPLPFFFELQKMLNSRLYFFDGLFLSLWLLPLPFRHRLDRRFDFRFLRRLLNDLWFEPLFFFSMLRDRQDFLNRLSFGDLVPRPFLREIDRWFFVNLLFSSLLRLFLQ